MLYVSTRGQAPELGFCDVVLSGLATDGGLYLPQSWPQFTPAHIATFANLPYAKIAFEIIFPFVDGEISERELKAMLDQAYEGFRHPSIAPLIELEPGHFVLELFHGPTLAFKDIAMQLLARIMDHILEKRGQRATIVGATSGDTGSAAIEAFRGRANTDIFILHPKGRVSDVQRRQMTTVLDDNVHNIAIEGSFDDCQNLVKSLFLDSTFRADVQLSGVNSINWGRILAQIVYFFTSGVALGAPGRKISYCVPTGNFGDVFAGYAAQRMGLPIEKLVIATNSNDILRRAYDTQNYKTTQVVPTISPSMDIQISSNFERLLFEASGHDASGVRAMMNSLKQSGAFEISPEIAHTIAETFSVGTASEFETETTIDKTFQASAYLLDPHSAVAVHVARLHKTPSAPMITLATAHPAKFPDAVSRASGIDAKLPHWLADLHQRREKCDVLANDAGILQDYIRTRIRAQGGIS